MSNGRLQDTLSSGHADSGGLSGNWTGGKRGVPMVGNKVRRPGSPGDADLRVGQAQKPVRSQSRYGPPA
jgi:hypothetical protein